LVKNEQTEKKKAAKDRREGRRGGEDEMTEENSASWEGTWRVCLSRASEDEVKCGVR
jgi:hypothetical protein